jgi:hypothetical protein
MVYKITLYKNYVASSCLKSFKTYKKAFNYAKKYFKDHLFNIYIEKMEDQK